MCCCLLVVVISLEISVGQSQTAERTNEFLQDRCSLLNIGEKLQEAGAAEDMSAGKRLPASGFCAAISTGLCI